MKKCFPYDLVFQSATPSAAPAAGQSHNEELQTPRPSG